MWWRHRCSIWIFFSQEWYHSYCVWKLTNLSKYIIRYRARKFMGYQWPIDAKRLNEEMNKTCTISLWRFSKIYNVQWLKILTHLYKEFLKISENLHFSFLFIATSGIDSENICVIYRTVPSATWPIFFEYFIFFWNNSKIW